METILMLLFIALIIALIVGLIKPALIIRWGKKPTQLKVLGWWFLSSTVIIILLLVIDANYTSEERINKAKYSIAHGNYSNAIGYLEKIGQQDALYSDAQTLLANAKTEEAKQKAEADSKATEQANSASTSRTQNISPSSISSVEEAKNYVNGKTFTATLTGGMMGLWHKVSFSNGSFSLWSTYPSSGAWGSPTKGTYSVEERRYSDTGQRYYLLRMTPEGENSPFGCLAFNIKETTFLGCDDVAAKAIEGDRNPWD